MSPGDRLPPEFLVDRALGIGLASAIQERGFIVHTLRSIYGEQRAQSVADEEWIPECAALGYIILTKDDAIRRYPPARTAAVYSKAKIFCLPNAHLSGAGIRERFLANLNRIIQRARQDGPFVYAVDHDGLRLLWPKQVSGS